MKTRFFDNQINPPLAKWETEEPLPETDDQRLQEAAQRLLAVETNDVVGVEDSTESKFQEFDPSDPFEPVPILSPDDEMKSLLAKIEMQRKEAKKAYSRFGLFRTGNTDPEIAKRQAEAELYRKAREY